MQERQMLKIIWQKAFNSKPLSNSGSYDRMMIILNLNLKHIYLKEFNCVIIFK